MRSGLPGAFLRKPLGPPQPARDPDPSDIHRSGLCQSLQAGAHLHQNPFTAIRGCRQLLEVLHCHAAAVPREYPVGDVLGTWVRPREAYDGIFGKRDLFGGRLIC